MSHSKGQRALGIAIFLTLAFCVLEFIGGKISGSLALLADAGHMLTDLTALILAYLAGLFSSKPATQRMSYGYHRLEVLSALVNGAALLTVAVLIIREAFYRFSHPPEIQLNLMMGVAAAGLVVNLLNGFALKNYAEQSINIRGAFFHVVSDALGSIGTLAAGLIIMLTGWYQADALVSCVIAVLIVISAWRLLKDVVEVLLEATPAHIDPEKIKETILALKGSESLHDLHIWSIAPGKVALSAHLSVDKGMDKDKILLDVNELLYREFKIDHVTLQIETANPDRRERAHFHD